MPDGRLYLVANEGDADITINLIVKFNQIPQGLLIQGLSCSLSIIAKDIESSQQGRKALGDVGQILVVGAGGIQDAF